MLPLTKFVLAEERFTTIQRLINERMHQLRLTQSQLAKTSHVSATTLSDIITVDNPDTNGKLCNLHTLKKILTGLEACRQKSMNLVVLSEETTGIFADYLRIIDAIASGERDPKTDGFAEAALVKTRIPRRKHLIPSHLLPRDPTPEEYAKAAVKLRSKHKEYDIDRQTLVEISGVLPSNIDRIENPDTIRQVDAEIIARLARGLGWSIGTIYDILTNTPVVPHLVEASGNALAGDGKTRFGGPRGGSAGR